MDESLFLCQSVSSSRKVPLQNNTFNVTLSDQFHGVLATGSLLSLFCMLSF